MTNHPELIVHKSTTPAEVADFIKEAASKDKSGGTWHLRAYETTYTPPGGQPCTVKILFVRSGRENPVDWFKNMWSRAQQYKLARNVLQEVAGPTASAHPRMANFSKENKEYARALQIALLNEKDKGLTLASIDTAVKIARFELTYMKFESSEKVKLADFLNVQTSDREEFGENFDAFSRLARLLRRSRRSVQDFPELIQKEKRLSSLMSGAGKFAQRWQQRRDGHSLLGNAAISQIDEFAIWLIQTYLPEGKQTRSNSHVLQTFT